MIEELKQYHAMIWRTGSDAPGQRVTVLARSINEAREKLEMEHGQGNVFDLHDMQASEKSR